MPDRKEVTSIQDGGSGLQETQSLARGGFVGYNKDIEVLCEQGGESGHDDQLLPDPHLRQRKKNLTLQIFTRLNGVKTSKTMTWLLTQAQEVHRLESQLLFLTVGT